MAKKPSTIKFSNEALADVRSENAGTAEAFFSAMSESITDNRYQCKAHNGFISSAQLRSTQSRTGRINVAAYIQVSTDSANQENSYETQELYFDRLIESNADWDSAGIYSDYGLSGTNKEKRPGFRRMMRHCQEGRIDRIVCKSISRFARNTADFLASLNALRDNRVTIFFEKEKLDTADPNSEFILTTLGAIAQEESRSISGNINLSNEMRFSKGDVPNEVIYGYQYSGEKLTTDSGYQYKGIKIKQDEAEAVHRIFTEVSVGYAFTDIAKHLNLDGIPNPESPSSILRKSKSKKGQLNSNLDEGWTARHISQIIRNERYSGDVLIRKTYTADYLTHTVKTNNGEATQYLVKNHHAAIIDRDLYEQVQKVRCVNQSLYDHAYSKRMPHAFTKRLICGECGRFFEP